MASAKSTFTSTCLAAGVVFAKTIEVSERGHILTLLAPANAPAGAGTPVDPAGSKPKAPGRRPNPKTARRRFTASAASDDA
jgi:hypothetical protein